MEESTSREKVLKRVRNALISKTDTPFPKIDLEKPVFKEMEESSDINFAQEFTKAGGKFIYCENEDEAIKSLRILSSENHWEPIYSIDLKINGLLDRGNIPYISGREDLTSATVGVTGCEFLIARYGSVMVSSNQATGRRINVFPDVHVVIAYTSQLVPELKDAFGRMKKKYETRFPSMITVITGPSRTADIEKTLVMGAHGPKEIYVMLIEDRN
jgi:L-lactate dehydrogenase complex protein LldG